MIQAGKSILDPRMEPKWTKTKIMYGTRRIFNDELSIPKIQKRYARHKNGLYG
jgi:hypothetical protein